MKSFYLALLTAASSTVHGAAAAPTTYVCDYKTYSNEKGLHKVDAAFVLTFLLDASTQKAYLIGNNGSSEVLLLAQDAGLTFVEITDSGNAMVTAIAKNGSSVHSRTGIILNEIVPSQYYGSCKTQ